MDSLVHVEPAVSRHKCLIYEGHPSEQLPVIVPLLIEGLRENRRCLYLGDPEMLRLVGAQLSAKGVEVAREAARGALVLSSERGHLAGGTFDPVAMVATLRRLVQEAVRDGFAGLWATGDMRWELGSDANFERLRDYEARLELAFRELPLAGVCQYHRDSVPPQALLDALATHRSAFVGTELSRDNLFYVPPEILLGGGRLDGERLAEWMWRQLRRITQAERERDLSLKALEELNRALEERVRERTADLEAFGYAAAHDLKAPLRAITGFSRDILDTQRDRLDERGRAGFARVVEAAGRMGHLIDGLLQLYNLSKAELAPEPVDLSRLAGEAIDDLRRAEPGRSVEVSVEPGLTARGDPRLLSALLANLLANAWKFTAKAPRASVTFSARGTGRARVYAVRDNGAGFDMAQAGRLFEPFFRLHAASEFPGSGIGLATALRIVTRHGGALWAEASPGRGAVFSFTLPGPAL